MKRKCFYCGNELETEGEYCDAHYTHEDNADIEEGEVLCSDCYCERYETECSRCLNYYPVDFQGRIGGLLVVSDDDAGVDVGTYRIAAHPYFMQSMIGGGRLHDNALERISPTPHFSTGHYPVAHYCPECEAELSRKCQEEATFALA